MSNVANFNQLLSENKTGEAIEFCEAMIKAPILIERPIVLANGQASIGRPPESVLGIL